jgi:hypothetical protein
VEEALFTAAAAALVDLKPQLHTILVFHLL